MVYIPGKNDSNSTVTGTTEIGILRRTPSLTHSFLRRQKTMSILKNIASTVTSSFLDKPEYKVVSSDQDKKDKGYEERVYPPCRWVSTTVKGMKQKDCTSIGFWRCFNYIQGKNDKGIKIEMTAPVTMKVEPGAGPNCESSFTTSFYVPPIHQEDTPKPTDPDVFIEERPEMRVLVSSFGGFANDESWLAEAQKLSEKVQQEKECCRQDCWYAVGYNSPFQLFGRTNEIWFVKE